MQESRQSLGLDNFCPVSISLGLDNHLIFQSRLVSVSTTLKNSSLEESRSRQLENFRVSTGLGLDNLKIFESQKVSVSTTSLQKQWQLSYKTINQPVLSGNKYQ